MPAPAFSVLHTGQRLIRRNYSAGHVCLKGSFDSCAQSCVCQWHASIYEKLIIIVFTQFLVLASRSQEYQELFPGLVFLHPLLYFNVESSWFQQYIHVFLRCQLMPCCSMTLFLFQVAKLDFARSTDKSRVYAGHRSAAFMRALGEAACKVWRINK